MRNSMPIRTARLFDETLGETLGKRLDELLDGLLNELLDEPLRNAVRPNCNRSNLAKRNSLILS